MGESAQMINRQHSYVPQNIDLIEKCEGQMLTAPGIGSLPAETSGAGRFDAYAGAEAYLRAASASGYFIADNNKLISTVAVRTFIRAVQTVSQEHSQQLPHTQ